MHDNISQEPLLTFFLGQMPRPRVSQQACTVEMQVNISQEPLYTEFYRKNAGAQ